jgi:hypothetical protein
MARSDPAAVRWLIGIGLREHRVRARKSTAEAGKAIGTNHSKIVHMETGRYGQKPDEVARLLEFYTAPEAETGRLVTLATQDDGPAWWEPWRKVVSEDFATFLGLEGMAQYEFTYNPLVIPALFQTESYALALTGLSQRVPLDLQEVVVELRLERQGRLTERDPLRVSAVIEESALHRTTGDAEMMRAQLGRLIEVAKLPNVTIQILPTANALRATTVGYFNLVRLPGGRQIVYVESLYDGTYVHDRDEMRGYSLMVDSVTADALDERDSLALIKSVMAM